MWFEKQLADLAASATGRDEFLDRAPEVVKNSRK
jgi:hypothetical protein